MPEVNIQEAVKMIQWAFVNANNIKHIGLVGIQIVQMQLNEALKSLGEKEMENI